MTSTEPRSGSEQKAVEALVEAVDDFLHHLSARHIDVGGVCDVCGDDRGPKDWPCPTAALIEDFRVEVAALQDSGNGICGDRAPGMRGIPTEVCVLRAGHSGWHQAAPPPDAPRHPAMWNDPRPVPEGSTLPPSLVAESSQL